MKSDNKTMKKTLYFIFAFLFLGVFTSCEKFELDDHCPEENQENYVNPQDQRVNDDSDSEETGETGKPSIKSTAEDSQHGNNDSGTSNGNGSGDDSDSGNPDDDDLINDDSDNEDEGERPRNPNGNPAK